ncbi:SDR family NAD(P)-dependent oxidoreductase [Streptomyces sp. SH5]|uniref:SDR family NAD(P)-dependent oxidoreductase n=1 Tax=Streptomyces sp. SH5 TaxID=3041765 RepID=UPI00247827E3|nr:SDR family NAD(P)-dependent oxidoreductase [Streptomyces sp. SH5]WGP11703.1 SDR family NAD(P)-dependent oxidoreductase [Streptomyces sp. SH5]
MNTPANSGGHGDEHVVTVRLDSSDVARFARASGDHNPLHTDAGYARRTPFGQPVAHGVLAAVRTLAAIGVRPGQRLESLDIRFPAPVFPGRAYRWAIQEKGGAGDGEGGPRLSASLFDGDRPVLTLDAGFADAAAPVTGLPTGEGAVWSRTTAAARPVTEIRTGLAAEAPYAPDWAELDALVAEWNLGERGVGAQHLASLAWCSYTAGMELPGASSLLSRISLTFPAASGADDAGTGGPGTDDADADDDNDTGAFGSAPLWGEAEVTAFHSDFAALTVTGTLRSGNPDDGSARTVAEAEIQVRARAEAASTRIDRLTALLRPSDRLDGKVAVVAGGSRGLGAALVQALATQGCTVYLGYHRSREAAEEVRDALGDAAGRVLLAGGDCADPDWCAELGERVLAEQGRCDLLVLNACPPLHDMDVAADGGARLVEYVRESLAMVQAPTAAFLSHVAANDGTVLAISSAAVTDPPRGWPHYVAAKTALEGLLSSLAAEQPRVRCVVARPPRLLTTLTHAPVSGEQPLEPEVVAATLVARLSAPGTASGRDVELVEDFPASVAGAPAADPTPPVPAVSGGREDREPVDGRLVVSATFTAQPIEGALRFWSGHLGLELGVEFTDYGQIFQQLLDANSEFGTNRQGCNLLLLRLQDWPGDELSRVTEDFAAAVSSFAGRSRVPLVVLLCPASPGAVEDETRADALAAAERTLRAALEPVAGVHLLDWDHFGRLYRVDGHHDAMREELGHIPYTPQAYTALATVAMRAVRALLRPPAKVLVLDCDNTLWRGVCGEDGAEGVVLEEGHLRLQRWALGLRERGVLLALASKNVEQDVEAVFEREDMVLRPEHIAARRVNWEPKSLNMAALAEELGLGLDAFVFFDDNPVETAEMAAAHPQVLTLTLPGDAAAFPALLDHLWVFDQLDVTAEDGRRADYYRAGQERDRFRRSAMDYSAFIEGLGLDIAIAEATAEQIPRVSQLTYRTNQFNTTAVRRTESEIRGLADEGGTCWATVVSDRFGDYGLVSVAFTRGEGDALVVDGLMMSCRVLGRGVEHQVLAHLGEQALRGGYDRLDVPFRPTERNAPVRRFLDSVAGDHAEPESAGSGENGASGSPDGALVYRLPAEEAAAVTFRPVDPAEQEEPSAAEAEPSGQDRAEERNRTEAAAVAVRPESLVAIATELTGIDEVHARITADRLPALAEDGSGDDRSGGTGDVLTGVREAFREVLRVPLDRLREGTTLEELQLSSFTIVDLTVRLEREFGPLPRTLLFEHRTLGGVVEAIAGRLGLAPAPAPGRAENEVRRPAARAATASAEYGGSEPIAIVGVAGRYPGARDLDELARRLLRGQSSVTEIPEERWDHTRYFDPSGTDPAGSYSKWACLLDDVARFDSLFFGISPREAELMDPQQRLFLEVAYETLQDAGHTPDTLGSDVGVYVGAMAPDYAVLSAEAALDGRATLPYSAHYQIANRVSYAFDFTGPSLSVDTACSSSGVALHLAAQDLRLGRVDAALVGGVNLILHPSRHVQYAHMGMLSRTGRCRAFGAGADGMVMGEGVGAVLLKPLSQALRDGDRVHALIRGTATNSGGRTQGFTVPSPDAQAQLVTAALRDARVDPATVGVLEAHGTGTPLGDPIEITGLTKAFGPASPERARCAVGSVKTTIGHLEPAAAIAGLTKVLLQLRHRTIMPTPGAETPNPDIEFGATPFFVPDRPMPWDAIDGTRRAGISSFGAGGVNAHVVVEEYSGAPLPRGAADGSHLVVLSAKDGTQLARHCADVAARIKDDAGDLRLSEVAYQSQMRRQPLAHRMAVLVDDPHRLADVLTAAAAGSPPAEGCWITAFGPDEPRPAPESFETTVRDALEARDLAGLAEAWVAGAEVRWADLHDGPLHHAELPFYPFARVRHWLRDAEPARTPVSDAVPPAFDARHLRGVVDGLTAAGDQAKALLDRLAAAAPAVAAPTAAGVTVPHPLVHRNVSDFTEERFRSHWTEEEPLAADYRVDGRPCLPGAVWIEAARAAVALAHGRNAGDTGVRLVELAWYESHGSHLGASRPVDIGLAQNADGSVDFDCYEPDDTSADGDDVRVLCQGRATLVPPTAADRVDLRGLLDGSTPLGTPASHRAALGQAGLRLGACYEALAELRQGEGYLLAELRLPPAAAGPDPEALVAHPVLLTSALLVAAVRGGSGAPARLEPSQVAGVTFHAPCGESAYAVATEGAAPGTTDLDLCDRDGHLLIRLSGIRFARGDEGTC